MKSAFMKSANRLTGRQVFSSDRFAGSPVVLFAQRFLAVQSMQVRAVGIASRRAGFIGLEQLSQIP